MFSETVCETLSLRTRKTHVFRIRIGIIIRTCAMSAFGKVYVPPSIEEAVEMERKGYIPASKVLPKSLNNRKLERYDKDTLEPFTESSKRAPKTTRRVLSELWIL